METKPTAIDIIINELHSQRYEEAFGKTIVPDTLIEIAKGHELEQLRAAFEAGWMRANATSYDPAYFHHYLKTVFQ